MLHVVVLALVVSSQSRTGLVPASLIVGRAPCGATTWLLTDKPALIEIRLSDPQRPVIHPVSGLQNGDKPWGLACAPDGALWTLASPRALTRIDSAGRLVDRVLLQQPKLGLLGFGGQLLMQQLPMAVGSPVLLTAPFRQPNEARPWPVMLARAAATREREIARNLVVCGIAFEATMPCWFADSREMTWSDGTSARTVAVEPFLSSTADREAPVRDVAVVGHNRYWLLESGPGSPSARGVAGSRLVLVGQNVLLESAEVRPGARLLVAATDSTCLLVTADGALIQWTLRP